MFFSILGVQVCNAFIKVHGQNITDDLVYMPKVQDLDEYIQNDTGKVWVGTHRQIRSRPWVFGQFEDSVLPAALYVLDRSSLHPVDRGDPVKVGRPDNYNVNDETDSGCQGNICHGE